MLILIAAYLLVNNIGVKASPPDQQIKLGSIDNGELDNHWNSDEIEMYRASCPDYKHYSAYPQYEASLRA